MHLKAIFIAILKVSESLNRAVALKVLLMLVWQQHHSWWYRLDASKTHGGAAQKAPTTPQVQKLYKTYNKDIILCTGV